MINYILQVILFQVLFLAIYDFFLSKETFFTKNRWYLISTPILSFLIPLIKVPSFQKAVSEEFTVYLPEIVFSPEKVIQNVIQESTFYQSINYVAFLFWIGVSIFLILFLIKLVKIISLIRKYDAIQQANFTLVFISKTTSAFSFFNYVFLGKEIPISQQEKIIQHELVHSKQRHSLDLLFFEVLKIVMWFNPMIYFYQQRITLVHEYISDAVVSKKEVKEIYINNLLSNYFQVENISFVNQFYKQTYIKKRIIMMKKEQSKKVNQLKYLVLVPALVSMLFYTSCSGSSSNKEVTSEKKIQTMYRYVNGELVSFKGNRFSYLDNFIANKAPDNGEEISFDELSEEEQNEFKKDRKHLEDSGNKGVEDFKQKFFKMPNGRISYGFITKDLIFSKSQVEIEEISFLNVQKMPTFPDCQERDADCFFKKIDNHFTTNFNMNIIDDIFISSGNKKILVDFSIDTKGEVVDVKVNAPHLVIEQEVINVINSLPKMTHGAIVGKPVKTKYVLPFTSLVK
jgi:bla regulator protein BlaR1